MLDLFGRNAAKDAGYWRAVAENTSKDYMIALGIIASLRAKIEALTAPPPKPQASATPLWISETEEDIKWARDSGILATAEAEDMLRELEFENTEIMFDPDFAEIA